jgi:hypothetical protein
MQRQRPTEQIEFGFDGGGHADGYWLWTQGREQEMREMARRLGLPLAHEVEVWLKDGTLLKGRLMLREYRSDVELMIGRVGFSVSEIQSCVRVD